MGKTRNNALSLRPLASWEVVLKNVPSNLSNRTATFEQALKKLKESS